MESKKPLFQRAASNDSDESPNSHVVVETHEVVKTQDAMGRRQVN